MAQSYARASARSALRCPPVQFTTRNSNAIRAGEVTVSFRNWRRPHAKAGGVYRLRPNGAVRVTAVGDVRLGAIEAAEAVRAGFESVDDLAAFLKLPPEAMVTKVEFELVGDEHLRRPPTLSVEQARERLNGIDRRSAGAWTAKALLLIRANPAVRAGDLAPALGWETPKFKANVRKLKALGLTRSLETGYRLSDLGERVAAALAGDS